MLIVKPLSDPGKARKIYEAFGRSAEDGIMGYYAEEADEDGSKKLLGLCLFTLSGGKDEIVVLEYAVGTHDDEAMIIMARAVLSFMYRCGVKSAKISSSVDGGLIGKLGFTSEDGVFSLDLVKFYGERC